jgi:MerR family transcriptional regulator/heat shock protein HspR
MEDKRRPKYSISVVAEMFEVHPQTLRLYEREGLIKPQRTERNTRMFCDDDVERLKSILNLTQEMGVNLAGVELILRMREQMDHMRDSMEHLLVKLQAKIEKEFTKRDFEELEGLVPVRERSVMPVDFDEEND